LFYPAWISAFSVKNVLYSFENPGIFLYNPSKILNILQKPIPELCRTANLLHTPMTSRAIHRAHRVFKSEPIEQRLDMILRANLRLAAQHSIDQHTIIGLTNAMKLERKKRQRGKKLNLLGESDVGPQFFSPARIQAARLFQAQKVDTETARKQRIADKKATAIVVRQQKEAEKAACTLQHDLNRQYMKEVKA
jgi:hypothetical protein